MGYIYKGFSSLEIQEVQMQPVVSSEEMVNVDRQVRVYRLHHCSEPMLIPLPIGGDRLAPLAPRSDLTENMRIKRFTNLRIHIRNTCGVLERSNSQEMRVKCLLLEFWTLSRRSLSVRRQRTRRGTVPQGLMLLRHQFARISCRFHNKEDGRPDERS